MLSTNIPQTERDETGMHAVPAFIVADNQELTRVGLHAFIARVAAGAPVTDVLGKKDLIAAAEKNRKCVVLLDYTLFDFRGIEDFLVLQKRFAGAVWILFSTELSEAFIRCAATGDNVGIVFKDSPGEEIFEALTQAVRGKRYLCSRVTGLLAESGLREPRLRLTAAEIDILKAIAKGKSVKEIAAGRVSSVHTVVTHKKNLFRKLGINSVYEATRYALRAGLVEMVEYYI